MSKETTAERIRRKSEDFQVERAAEALGARFCAVCRAEVTPEEAVVLAPGTARARHYCKPCWTQMRQWADHPGRGTRKAEP